jgi:hypothetical protein
MINVGSKYFYKLSKSRGRPFVGEVTRKAGIFTEVVNKDGVTVRVPTKFIGKEYHFKPYNKKSA